MFEAEDFPDMTPELKKQDASLRERAAHNEAQ